MDGAGLPTVTSRFVAFAFEPTSTSSHGNSRRQDRRGRMFSHPREQGLNLLFLTTLQGLNLHHVFFPQTTNFFLQGFILRLRVVVIVAAVMGMCVLRVRGGG